MTTNRAMRTLGENSGGLGLFIIGVVMIVAAIFNLEHEVGSAALIVAGLVAVGLGAVLNRAEGPLKVTKDGFEAFLKSRQTQADSGETTPLSDVLPAEGTSQTEIEVAPGANPIEEPQPEDPAFTKVLPRARVELTEGAKRDLDQYEPHMRKGILSSILLKIANADTYAQKHSSPGSLEFFTASLGPSMTMAFRESDKPTEDGEGRYIVLGIYPAEVPTWAQRFAEESRTTP